MQTQRCECNQVLQRHTLCSMSSRSSSFSSLNNLCQGCRYILFVSYCDQVALPVPLNKHADYQLVVYPAQSSPACPTMCE